MCGVVLGTACQLQQSALWPLAAYVGVVMLALAVGAFACGCARKPTARHRVLWCSVGLALAFGVAGWRAAVFQAGAMPAAWEGRDVRVTGVIVDVPQSTEHGVRLRFRIEHAQALEVPHTPVRLPEHVTLTWYGEAMSNGLRAGQRWVWTVRLKAPHGARNPHAMDWELWLWSQGIQASGYIRRGPQDASPQWLGHTRQALIAQARGQVLRRMQTVSTAHAQELAALGVVQALVTGAQSRITPAHWQLFRDTGVAHLVSISGLHITMFAWLAMAVVNGLWRRSARCCLWLPAPIAAAWVGWCMALAYALFSGWGIPAQRTIGMLLIVVLLRSCGQRWPWPYVWLVVLTVVVLRDPWSLLQAGFWLSFVAVGVLFAAQPQQRQVHERIRRWWHIGARLVREQGVVGLALAPLTLLLFGQISVVGMLANLWAIPWVTLCITPLAMLGVLWPPLWTVAADGVQAMVWLLEVMHAWPMAVMHFAQPPLWVGAVGVLACIWMALPLGWRWRGLGLPWALPMLCWVPATPTHGQFDVLALDVGQGSALLVRTQQHSLLFDAGPRWSEHANAGERTVVPVLRALGAKPDVMVISHADSDHTGGAASVQQAFAGMAWMGAGGQPCAKGKTWEWDGVVLEMLHPFTASLDTAVAARQRNASSCVLRVRSSQGVAALLTGDIEAAQEHALIASGANLQAQLLVVAHHGSRTSSTTAWIAAVQPAVAVVQAGYRNRFNHPAPVVLQRFADADVPVWSTPTCGAAWWQSWQPERLSCERAVHRRYWSYAAP